MPAGERERLRRADALTAEGAYDTHPPTHRRVALLHARPPEVGRVVVPTAELSRAGDEVGAVLAKLGQAIRQQVRADLTPAEREQLGY